MPPDHPLIPTSRLQAEALGLLDRILNVFQDSRPLVNLSPMAAELRDSQAFSDTLLVTATINSIGVLVRTRPAVANRILSAMLNFNPFQSVSFPIEARAKIRIKSMERTIRAFLLNLNKRSVLTESVLKMCG